MTHESSLSRNLGLIHFSDFQASLALPEKSKSEL